MAALVCHGMSLHLHRTRISGVCSPQSKRTSNFWGVSNLGFHGFGSSVQQKRICRKLQVVVTRAAAEGEDEKMSKVALMDSVKGVAKSVLEAASSVQKPAMVALLFCLLVSQGPEMAFAASGGRVGGNSFRSYYFNSLWDFHRKCGNWKPI